MSLKKWHSRIMQDMKKIIKISGLLLVTMFVSSLSAQSQDPDCFIKKTYPAKPGTTLRISCKYGDVNFSANKSDSISVCTTVTIEQADRELARKSFSLVSVKIDKLNDTVSVATSFDKKFFSETLRQGRKNFSVDILVKAPAFINIDIINEFGNVTAEEVSGKFNVRLSYGIISATNLTRGNITPINSINVDNGKVNIDALNWISANISNCSSVEIGKAQALLIKSDFSKIRIRAVSSMVADSKSDIYSIDSLKNIISESLYSTININKFNGKMLSKVRYGSLKIAELQKDFSNIDITSVNAPINIETGNAVSFRSDIVVSNAPTLFLVKGQDRIFKNEHKNSVSYTGIAGENLKTESIIKINSTSGKVTIK
jgi:hypothetical protein